MMKLATIAVLLMASILTPQASAIRVFEAKDLTFVELAPAFQQARLTLQERAAKPFDLPKIHGVPVQEKEQQLPAGPWGDETVAALLAGKGLTALMHGSVADSRQWAVAAHNPANFFDFRIYPLRAADAQVAQLLAGLKLERHDLVRIKGALRSQPPHIRVTGIELVRRDPTDFSRPEAERREPLDLKPGDEKEIQVVVHGILRGGGQVVVDYKNHILPLTLEDADDAAAAKILGSLYRWDAIKVNVKVRSRPGAPTHLVFDAAKGLTMLEAIRDWRGKTVDLEGYLVLFHKSPITRRDVWAVAVKSPKTGVTRTFTLNNFFDEGKWDRLDARLKAEWDRRSATMVQGRNKYHNPALVLRVKGTVLDLTHGDEELARNQANQTVMVAEPEHAEFLP